MPKLIILFHSGDVQAATLAENAAVGARGVRFTEVDIRSVGSEEAAPIAGVRQRRLESANQLREYDGVVIACSATNDLPDDFARMLDELDQVAANQFANSVFTLLGAEQTPLLARVARLGAIVVCVGPEIVEPTARAAAAGARAAKVVGWVRHALSHERQDQHHHDHEHQHPPA